MRRGKIVIVLKNNFLINNLYIDHVYYRMLKHVLNIECKIKLRQK